MASVNPYRAPAAAVADTAEEYQPVKIFAVSGRIGRARYIAYTLGLWLVVAFAAGMAAALLGTIGAIFAMVAYVGMLVVGVMLTVQRAHDFDTTGWLALVILIPLVNLIFWIIPGTDGGNRFGAKTPPNTVLVLIGAWLVPILFFTGIIAAIALPAYQDYVKRAQQMQRK